jgi:hypothetical protein
VTTEENTGTPFTCPVAWCTARADVHDDVDPRIGEHALYVFESPGSFGEVGVHQTVETTESGHTVTHPAEAFIDLYTVAGYFPGNARILAKAFELVALIADGINAGEWEVK